MSKNTVKGAAKQVKGAVQSAVGGATNNRSLQAKGEVNKVAGKVQSKIGKMEDSE